RFREEALAVGPDDLATLIYTSGTTGPPKGVMLTHNNIWSDIVSSTQVLAVGQSDTCLAWLPLSHILERMVEYVFLRAGVTINYAESIDSVAHDLAEVRPTLVLGVPRLYEEV